MSESNPKPVLRPLAARLARGRIEVEAPAAPRPSVFERMRAREAGKPTVDNPPVGAPEPEPVPLEPEPLEQQPEPEPEPEP